MFKISNDSLVKISWGALVAGGTILIGFSAWMTSVDSKAATAQEMIVGIKEENKESSVLLNNIDKRLQRIEVILEEVFFKKQNKNKEN